MPPDKSTSSTRPVITLTSDFGQKDGYVGAMNGVILRTYPNAILIDITHEVPPQDIAHGAFVMHNTCKYFPRNAIHVDIVDPCIGSERWAVLLVTPIGLFIAPDNGILSYFLLDCDGELQDDRHSSEPWQPYLHPVPKGCEAFELTNDRHWEGPINSTFHGKDICGPVASHFANGTIPSDVGESYPGLSGTA